MNRVRTCSILMVLCATFLTGPLISSGALAETCEAWIAKVVSVQGGVHVLRAGEKQWRPVKLNDTFCPGDMMRILKQSRADVALSNNGILRLDQSTTVTFSEPDKERTLLITLREGAAYFFSRVRRSLRIFTPFVNAIGEGTEFLVRVETDKAFVSVFEGRVALTNDAGSITLARGQSAVAGPKVAPALHLLMRPRDAVQWTLYYPPILYYRPADLQGGPPAGWKALVQRSMEFYVTGDIEKALGSIEEVREEVADPRFFDYRASLLLSVGRADEARFDIGKALQIAPGDSRALALQSIISVAQNDKEMALSLAKKAVEADPQSASARIALSYAQQTSFDLQGTLSSLSDAVQLEPENALAWARLAELKLSLGQLKEALEAANRAVSLNPDLARTQAVLGFAYLAQIKTKTSKDAFQKAIALDQADPLPRLGLGLAKIRDGDLAEGRAEIEIAASLDPNNSLVRSYLGKAYYEEKRDMLASDQLSMAKELDPSDPTPFFYDAIRKQSINQPVEALYDLQKAISLNDNRAVYRSRLLLDSDLAARSASLGRIYSDLGFQQLALVEGWKSVNIDPANYSAHRFLADSYSSLPRHEIARVSELLQSQLLQPININPIQPHLAESNLSILNGAGLGPADLSFNEFNPLFNRNRFALQTSGIGGENRTLGDEVVQSGIWGPLSYSLGQFHYQTDGFRKNNDINEDIYNVFVQGMVSYHTGLMGEFRSTDKRYGDLDLRFFNDFLPNERQKEETRSMRIGFHHTFSPRSDVIGTFLYRDREYTLNDIPYPILGAGEKLDEDSYGGELQHLFRSKHFNTVSGVGYFYIDEQDKVVLRLLNPSMLIPPTGITKRYIHHTNLYLYSQINYLKNLTLTVGGSADFLGGGIKDRNQFNPKIGLTWTPFPATTLRAALFRTLKRTLIADQTLEPTQVAGFNQFHDDLDSTESWRYGVAVDQRLAKGIYAGAEYSGRYLRVPSEQTNISVMPPATRIAWVDWRENLGRAYLYWTPHPWFGIGAEYQYERLDREENTSLIRNIDTHRFPLGINFYHPSGLSAQLKATYVYQEGKFLPQTANAYLHGSDQFLVFDGSISYRLPNRHGLITVGAKNLFDKSFKFQDTDPANPSITPKRMVFGKFTLAF